MIFTSVSTLDRQVIVTNKRAKVSPQTEGQSTIYCMRWDDILSEARRCIVWGWRIYRFCALHTEAFVSAEAGDGMNKHGQHWQGGQKKYTSPHSTTYINIKYNYRTPYPYNKIYFIYSYNNIYIIYNLTYIYLFIFI